MAQIPVERQTPLGHMDALDVLRRRLPAELPPAPERGQSSKTVNRVLAGQTVLLAAWSAPMPTPVTVQAVMKYLGAPPTPATPAVYFQLQWSNGGAEGPPINFNVSEPITIMATTVTLTVVNAGATDATQFVIHGSIAAPGQMRQSRPLWWNPANSISIAFGATSTFTLAAFTRRVRVARANIVTPFTVIDGTGTTVQAILANGEFAWREILGPTIGVQNNAAAGADTFQLFEELGL